MTKPITDETVVETANNVVAAVKAAINTIKVTVEGQTLDIDAEIAEDDNTLRLALALFYPQAETATIQRTKVRGVETIAITPQAGPKGCVQGAINAALAAAPESINPILAIYAELQEVDLADMAHADALAISHRVDRVIKEGEALCELVEDALKRLRAAPVDRFTAALVLGF